MSRKRFLTGLVMACLVFFFSQASQAEEAKYVGSKESNKYHLATCGIAKNIKPANLVQFNTEAEAVKAGYKACKICIKGDKQKVAAFIGSKDSDKYHLPGCKRVEKIAGDKQVAFSSKEEAEKAGYKPCQICLKSEKVEKAAKIEPAVEKKPSKKSK